MLTGYAGEPVTPFANANELKGPTNLLVPERAVNVLLSVPNC